MWLVKVEKPKTSGWGHWATCGHLCTLTARGRRFGELKAEAPMARQASGGDNGLQECIAFPAFPGSENSGWADDVLAVPPSSSGQEEDMLATVSCASSARTPR